MRGFFMLIERVKQVKVHQCTLSVFNLLPQADFIKMLPQGKELVP
jgi:hypothetical protein